MYLFTLQFAKLSYKGTLCTYVGRLKMAHVNSTVVFTLHKVPNLHLLAKKPTVQYDPAKFRAAIVRPTKQPYWCSRMGVV